MVYNKLMLTTELAEKLNCTQYDAKFIIETFAALVGDILLQDHVVHIDKLGSLRVFMVKPRVGVNPVTKLKMVIPSKLKIKFKPAKKTKDALAVKFDSK